MCMCCAWGAEEHPPGGGLLPCCARTHTRMFPPSVVPLQWRKMGGCAPVERRGVGSSSDAIMNWRSGGVEATGRR